MRTLRRGSVRRGAGVTTAIFIALSVAPSTAGASLLSSLTSAVAPLTTAVTNVTTSLGVVNPLVPAGRDTEPIVITGASLPGWAAPTNLTLDLPLTDIFGCPTLSTNSCAHNNYATPTIDTAKLQPSGPPIDRFLGYRWDPAIAKFVQIPFQVDEVFTRYLDNAASGFAIYSGDDQHTTYAYDGTGDREGFRYTADGPASNPCQAQPASAAAHDPIAGLDTNDELSFMASDAGPAAPLGTPLPAGILGARRFTILDPLGANTIIGYVYVMQSSATGPRAAFNASNGYVHYQRDANADQYRLTQSSYENYGNAAQGVYCDADGNVVRNPDGTPKIARRRPLDTATVTTPRYSFRYDGRWLMSQIHISADGGHTYGPDLVDRWKARAFAQDPGSSTPCCGYEDEDQNWGGSSTLLGERIGPVRAIRETWGADSGTNTIHRETFYRDEFRQDIFLRVHPVPPADGIYAQWDFNAGRMDRYYNPQNARTGVAIDGRNDDMFGNFDDPCNPKYDTNSTSAFDQGYRTLYRALQLCQLPYHLSADETDPLFSGVNAALGWNVTTGNYGTLVDRISLNPQDITPGAVPQDLLATPYYRDDSCFDDGTGTDPGPKVIARSANEPTTSTATGQPRKCWTPADGIPDGSDRFYQGSIGTHGIHLLAVAETDNARQTIPLDEVAAQWRMVMLPGRRDGTVGEQYGRDFEKPLVAIPSG